MMIAYTIRASKLSGNLIAPPSKSHTLRAILFASMATGKSVIHHYLRSPDTTAMITACCQLGANITVTDNKLEITGVSGSPSLPDDVINAGNSGQVLRFIAAIGAIIDGHIIFTGDHSIRFNRPVTPLLQGLTDLGATCLSVKGDDHAPIIIKGPIKPGHAILQGADSQPVSGLLIASAFMQGTTKISVIDPGEKPWVALTLAWLDKFGIHYTNDNYTHYTVQGQPCIPGFEYTVPGDFSSVAYPIVSALVTGSQLSISNIDLNDAQGDKKIIDVLIQMGANIKVGKNSLQVFSSTQLQGIDVDVNDFIDALPILAVIGCYAAGTMRLTNAAIARKKESDRLRSITKELRKMGALIQEHESSLEIIGGRLHAAELDSHHDHRIAMSLMVASLGIEGCAKINDVACVGKSYPTFFTDMQALGANLAEVG